MDTSKSDAQQTQRSASRPAYERPKITPMDRDDVLQAFQMTAAQISAAGCWWAPGCAGSPCKYD